MSDVQASVRGQLRLPVLARETVAVPEIGGAVVVRGLRLSERLAFLSSLPQRGDGGRDRFLHVPELLALTVLYDDGTPVADVEGWEAIGAEHLEMVMRLFDVAQRLAGLKVEDEKKS